jgi:hypothetical protein
MTAQMASFLKLTLVGDGGVGKVISIFIILLLILVFKIAFFISHA